MNPEITIESLESLAELLETDMSTRAAKLMRMIRAFARIIQAREPEHFVRMPTEYGDVSGHSDNSFPPKQVYRSHNGPRLLEIAEETTEEVSTSSGFYYSWRVETTDPGLYIARDGAIWGAERTGTGRLGQFAAHPGDCDVEIEISYNPRSDVSLSELETVEQHLRKLAFPLIAQAQAQAAA
jgi:hypothetical protein